MFCSEKFLACLPYSSVCLIRHLFQSPRGDGLEKCCSTCKGIERAPKPDCVCLILNLVCLVHSLYWDSFSLKVTKQNLRTIGPFCGTNKIFRKQTLKLIPAQVDYVEAMDEIADEISVKPDIIKIFMQDFQLGMKVKSQSIALVVFLFFYEYTEWCSV